MIKKIVSWAFMIMGGLFLLCLVVASWAEPASSTKKAVQTTQTYVQPGHSHTQMFTSMRALRKADEQTQTWYVLTRRSRTLYVCTNLGKESSFTVNAIGSPVRFLNMARTGVLYRLYGAYHDFRIYYENELKYNGVVPIVVTFNFFS